MEGGVLFKHILVIFEKSPKLKTPNLSTFQVDFIEKYVVFGNYVFIFLKIVSMIKRDKYAHSVTVLEIQMYVLLLKINTKLI